MNGSPVIDLAVANCFARDKTGRLWIGSVDGGMWYLDERTNKFVRLKPDNYKSESFHFNDMVYSITKGMLAPQAAAVIHTDFEKGFIRAEVIKYDDFIKYETEAVCRDNGKLAVQGKDYLVEDGDIMHFRFNV